MVKLRKRPFIELLYITVLIALIAYLVKRMHSQVNQETRDQQHIFLKKCEDAYLLVEGYLNDTLAWYPIPSKRKDYQFDPELRERVKEKVILSMEKLEQSIGLHGYV